MGLPEGSTGGRAVTDRTILIVGGSAGIGLELAKDLIAGGDRVIVTSRSQDTADAVASELGDRATGVTVDLSEPEQIAARLASVGKLDGVVLTAIERDANTVRDYDIDRARRLITLKLIGYTETIHTLLDRLEPTVDTGIVLFGGRAKDAPYPGSTTVSTINGGVDGLMNTLALELAPIRVNSLHPGIIGDSPFWAAKPEAVAGYEKRTPGGQLATMADIVDAAKFLLFNRGVSAHSLNVDRGWRIT
nr:MULTISPECIES: SDR family NAD(P)-dependent oxidoreductase [unclassified Cryobacterium]